MTKPGRIPCINPNCRRTAPADKCEPGSEIVCHKCWKLLPKAITNRYRTLHRRERKLLKLIEKSIGKRSIGTVRYARLKGMIEELRWKNWQEIRAYLVRPEKPIGLEGFLEEMGMSE